MSWFIVKIKLFALLFFVSLSSVIFVNSNSQKERVNSLPAWKANYAEHNYKQTLKSLKKVRSNNDLIVYYKLKSNFHLKKYQKVISFNSNVINNRFLNKMRLLYITKSFYNQKDYKSAVNMGKDISYNNDYIQFIKDLIIADSYYKLNDYKSASKIYKKLIQRNKLIRFHKIRENLVSRSYQQRIAYNLFQCYIKRNVNKKFVQLFNKYYYLLKKKKKKKEILLHIHNILQTNKFNIKEKVYFKFCQEMYYIGEKSKAGSHFNILLKKVTSLNIKLNSYFFLALINKDKKEQFNHFLRKIEQTSKSELSQFLSARALYLSHRRDEGIKRYIKILKIIKSSNIKRKIYKTLISFYRGSDAYVQYLEKYFHLFKNEQHSSRLYFLYALKKWQKKEYKEAVRILEQLTHSKHCRIQSRYLLGKYYLKEKQKLKAYNHFIFILQNHYLDYYFIESVKQLEKLNNKLIKHTLEKKLDEKKKNKRRYYFLKYLLTKKDKYKKRVIKEIKRKESLDNLAFGKDKLRLRRNRDVKHYTSLLNKGLHYEAYLVYRKFRRRFKKSLDYYLSMIQLSVDNEQLGDTLRYRLNALYYLKLSPYILCLPKQYRDYYYPHHYKEMIDQVIKKEHYKIKKGFLFALMREESRFDKYAVSIANAISLFQIIPSTGKYLKKKIGWKKEVTLFNLPFNVNAGIYYINRLLKKFDQNKIFALCAYNAGAHRMNKWEKKIKYDPDFEEVFIELIPYRETRNYVKKIMGSYYFYSKKSMQ